VQTELWIRTSKQIILLRRFEKLLWHKFIVHPPNPHTATHTATQLPPIWKIRKGQNGEVE